MENAEKLLTKEQVMEMLGIAKSTLYCWVWQRKIPHIKVGNRCLRFRERDILEWIASKAIRPQAGEEPQKTKRKRTPSRPSIAGDYIEGIINRAKKDALKNDSRKQ